MKRKVAVLSNVNMDYVSRELEKDFSVWHPEGYGNLWEQQMDPQSSFNQFSPDVAVLIVDAWQLTDGEIEYADAKGIVDEWFRMFSSARKDDRSYLISDIRYCHRYIMDMDDSGKDLIESYWKKKLDNETSCHANVHHLRLCDVIAEEGEGVFYSDLSWYLGKMPYTRRGYQALAGRISQQVGNMYRVPKKVLVLDLDNTLWGGILGECGELGIELSGDRKGAAYRDAQKMIKQMQRKGVLLAVCSKNNIDDVQLVWEKNPYMILKGDDFVSLKINWENKVENLKDIARQLNLGLESFVFIDDMAVERENVKMRLPMVSVPDFPMQQDKIPVFFRRVYEEYFQKSRATQEDLKKTEQYQQNEQRNQLQEQMDYPAFLKTLGLHTERVEPDDSHMARIVQLIQKTNQFNLTTRRYTEKDIKERMAQGWSLYAWNVKDRFGEYGLVSVALVDTSIPKIDLFVMSCRIMGKQLENYFLEQIEQDMRSAGKTYLQAEYIASAKNMPVRDFYDRMGYQVIQKDGEALVYEISLDYCQPRQYVISTD